MQEGAREFVELGRAPGDFLRAVLSDQLVSAWQRADAINRAEMNTWIQWLLGEPPLACWGSPAKVQAWIDRGGMRRESASESESELRAAWGDR
jgi:hypothetical protein